MFTEQHHRCLCPSSWLSVYIPLCFMPVHWHHINVSLFLCILCSCFSSEIRTSNLLTISFHVSHICLLTTSALEKTHSWQHVFCWSMVLVRCDFQLQERLFFRIKIVDRAQLKKQLCSSTHHFFPILSFISGALANIRHPFLMHSHMVILFFLTGIVPNKYK